MISKFIREETHYYKKDLMNIFECDTKELLPLLEELKKYGILKVVKKDSIDIDLTELINDDMDAMEISLDDANDSYVFKFVGVIAIRNYILKCYPKYIERQNPVNELKIIIKVLEKYNSDKQYVQMFNDLGESTSLSYLPLILFFLHDYYEHGIYTNIDDTFEINGEGEIDWNKTINETYPFIVENRPYYTTLFTKRKTVDESDYFKKLHECIITKFSSDLENAGLVDLFDFTPVYLSEEEIDDFGDRDYILYRLENEINIQFVTHKQLLLKALYSYIKNEHRISKLDGFSFIGTKSFKHVWETVCAEVFNNHLSRKLGTFKLNSPLHENYCENEDLQSVIDKPKWVGYVEGNKEFSKNARRTLTPDIVNLSADKMIIYDAKYYNLVLEPGKELKGQPGVADVTKQYFYHLAYKDFVEFHSIDTVENYFLFPTENDQMSEKGRVEMSMFNSKTLCLPPIKLILLPAKKVYQYYINNMKINISDLIKEV